MSFGKPLKATHFVEKHVTIISTEQNQATAVSYTQDKAPKISPDILFCRRAPKNDFLNAEHVAPQGCEQILAIILRCGCKRLCVTIGHKEMLTYKKLG